MIDVDIAGKRRRGRPTPMWKHACKIYMIGAALQEDNTASRAARGIRPYATPATPDDMTSQGRIRRRSMNSHTNLGSGI